MRLSGVPDPKETLLLPMEYIHRGDVCGSEAVAMRPGRRRRVNCSSLCVLCSSAIRALSPGTWHQRICSLMRGSK